ncbi:hypothetical protein [Nonlabens ponticola]|uniref:DUF4369 domain-containing protein n=1 Tax=Nonlabens ponticola TaxID=2496866 RepID=A0A3S9MW11_9FLAO|nr:hypothetical protein [Nonlabens ponticola]AZQ43317.1 hypothetical protein EJ995_03345 [Nonlabens ponticola]
MKNLFLFIAAAAISFAGSAQSDIAISSAAGSGGSGFALNKEAIISEMNDGTFDGSAYLYDDWIKGIVIMPDGVGAEYYMKYNVLEDRIEFSETADGKGIRAIPNNPNYVIQLGKERFQYLNFADVSNDLDGIFKIIKPFDEETILVRRYQRSIQDMSEAQKSSYSSQSRPRVLETDDFYFIEKGMIKEIKNHKKRSLKSLNEKNEKQLKAFIKDRDIDFDDEGKGLAEVIAYYLSLQK